MILEILWILLMLGLIISMIVVGLRERKARLAAAKVAAANAPASDLGDGMGGDGFGSDDPANMEFNPDAFGN